jgi:hypothetical protein
MTMPLLHSAGRLLLAGSALLLVSTAAQAQVRYIASTGNNNNNCASAATPCRTLQKGINTTPAGGELRILDSGDYGNGGLINQTMTISADGAAVMLSAPLTIDAAGSAVTLRGLALNGHHTAVHGIHIANAAAVHIDNCRVEHFTGVGVRSDGSNTRLFVNDSVSRENGGRGLNMMGQSTRLTVDNSRFENNSGSGIAVVDAVGSVTRTVTAGNLGAGISWGNGQLNVAWSMATDNYGEGYSLFRGRIHLESSVARGNRTSGLRMAGDVATISNFVATDNGTGIYNRGTVYSRQNNTVTGNTTNIDGPQPVALPPI